ncbi:MAG: hypothetical protein ACRDF0_09195, partial [Candidatus Limnocylindria bacterium]
MNALRLSSLALAFSLSHVIIDFAIGLYGSGATLTMLQAANIAAYAAVYGYWGWAFGAAREARWAVVVIALLAGVWAAFGQGVVGFAACPPPCRAATGFQDAAHLGSLVFGTWAASATVRALRRGSG